MTGKKFVATALLFCMFMLACGRGPENDKTGSEVSPAKKYVVVGFSQLGAESDWRNANTESMRSAFTRQSGYELLIENGQQKQANQIRAIRTFIQREVDYIVLAPVTETGWDTVLAEAAQAGIPVIIVDRMVDVSDDSLFTCWVGSDFELEGRKVAEWLKSYTLAHEIAPEEIHIVNIQGTLGGSAQIGRTKGLEEAAAENGWDLVAQEPGDYTQARAREVMKDFLAAYEQINVVYCENDNEALGAIEAIEDAGRKVGSDIMNGEIMVISFDGVREEAMRCVMDDRISCIAECNPLHGPRVRAIIELLEAGETPEKLSFVDEEIYTHDDTVTSVTVGGRAYPVKVVTQEVLEDRQFGALTLRENAVKVKVAVKLEKIVDENRFYDIMCNVYGMCSVHKITQSVMLLEGLKGGQKQACQM